MTTFFSRFLAHPWRVGAVLPSGPRLCRAIAATADLSGNVLELGPGSGAITAALLARGLPPERLTLIEYDVAFANLLRSRFAGLRVIEGDAFAFSHLIDTTRLTAVVCGMPLLNYPRERGRDLIARALSYMPPGSPFVQFSYGLGPPVPPPEGVSVTRTTRVWRNLPPAAVWLYRSAAP